jgi:hypothetical protein
LAPRGVPLDLTRGTMKPPRNTRVPQGSEAPGARTTPLAWYKWFPGDYLRLTRGWPLAARAVYRELLDAEWDLQILPASPRRLRDTVGATVAEWRVAWPFCEQHFPLDGPGRRNPALERLRATQVALVEQCRRGAQRANRARWGHRPTVVPLRPGGDDD